MKLLNRVKLNTTTAGTGTLTLGTAVVPYQLMVDAGAEDGRAYRYVLVEGNNWEIGWGIYTASGTTLTRNLEMSSTGALLNLAGTGATVTLGPSNRDFHGRNFPVPQQSGMYVCPDTVTFATGTVASSANLLNLYPYSRRIKCNAVSVEVTTLLAANNVRGGIYSCHPETGLPHKLIEEGTMQSVATTGIKDCAFAATRELLEPVWIATCFSGATTCRTIGNSSENGLPAGVFNFAGSNVRMTTPHTFGALPADISGNAFTITNSGYPMACLKMP